MHKPAESLLITLVQTALFWEDKERNLDQLAGKISAHPEKMEIVLLPEMFSTGFTMDPKPFAESMTGPTVSWMKQLAAEKKIVLAGSLIVQEAGDYFNRLVWALPNGEIGYYDKRHLFSYAGEDVNYTAGNKRLIASVKRWKVNLQVCYDLRFPVWARQTRPIEDFQSDIKDSTQTPEYDILVYVANWPEKRIDAWKALLKARAIENQCYVAGVNRTGYDGNNIRYSGASMVIDPEGRIMYEASDEEEIFTCRLSFETLTNTRSKLPFLRDGDPFIIGS